MYEVWEIAGFECTVSNFEEATEDQASRWPSRVNMDSSTRSMCVILLSNVTDTSSAVAILFKRNVVLGHPDWLRSPVAILFARNTVLAHLALLESPIGGPCTILISVFLGSWPWVYFSVYEGETAPFVFPRSLILG